MCMVHLYGTAFTTAGEPASQQDVFAHPDAELYVLVGADMNVER